MKQLPRYLILALVLSFSAQAAQNHKPDLGAIVEQLKLDPDQLSPLTSMMEKHHLEMVALHQAGQKTRQQMNALREKHQEELLSILDYEQLYRFNKYMHQRHREDRHDRPAVE